MSGRVVVCDFCSRPLGEGAWEFPARDLEYPAPGRLGPTGPVVEGSIGSWLACPGCAELVRLGDRVALVARSLARFARVYPGAIEANGGRRVVLERVRDTQDRFWTHREGEGRPLERSHLELIARDPEIIREPRRRR